jgi:hypothetical protein
MTKAQIVLDGLSDDDARALAQMCKRMIWDDFHQLSAGRVERDDMDSVTIKLRRALAISLWQHARAMRR